MKKNVFLSYSWKDRHVAMRLYNDLIRSNVPVWRDQIDGDPTADFQKEFLEKIEECDYFIMLDSINYRERSNWCCIEAQRCLDVQRKRNELKIIICLLDDDGSWRTTYKNEEFRKVFEQINGLKFQKLNYSGYDNSKVYDTALNFICDIIGTSYERWDKIPSYQDFMDELNDSDTPYDADDTSELILLDGYKNILRKIEKKRSNIRDSFLVWIDDCHCYNPNLFFPLWTYAVWLANQSSESAKESLEIFNRLTISHPNDPRGFRGVGNVSGYIGNTLLENEQVTQANDYYNIALSALLKAEQLIEIPENSRHKDICSYEVLKNIGMLYKIIHNNNCAFEYWNRALSIMTEQGFFDGNLIDEMFSLQKEEDFSTDSILNWIIQLQSKYPLEPLLYQLAGLCFSGLNDYKSSTMMLQRAYSMNPSMENLYYLLNSKINSNNLNAGDIKEIETLINYPTSNEDKEWIQEIKDVMNAFY